MCCLTWQQTTHNPEVAGSNPAPATQKGPGNGAFRYDGIAGGWSEGGGSVDTAAAAAGWGSASSCASRDRTFSISGVSSGCASAPLSASSYVFCPSSVYAWPSSRLVWTSCTPSFAFVAACSAAAFALSRKPIRALLSAEDVAQQSAAAPLAATMGGLEHAPRRAPEGQRLQRHVPRARHVDEEEALAAADRLLQPGLHLHLVLDRRLDHHHATGVDDQRLSGGQVEVDEVAASVQPHGALALQSLQEETFASAHDAHPHPLGERARDLHLTEVAEIGVLLADDLPVELVLADRPREGPTEADRSRATRREGGEEHALPRQHRPLQAADETAGHLDVHRHVAGDEHHRAGLGDQLLAGLERDDDRGSVPLTNLGLHPTDRRPPVLAAQPEPQCRMSGMPRSEIVCCLWMSVITVAPRLSAMLPSMRRRASRGTASGRGVGASWRAKSCTPTGKIDGWGSRPSARWTGGASSSSSAGCRRVTPSSACSAPTTTPGTASRSAAGSPTRGMSRRRGSATTSAAETRQCGRICRPRRSTFRPSCGRSRAGSRSAWAWRRRSGSTLPSWRRSGRRSSSRSGSSPGSPRSSSAPLARATTS